MNSFAPALSENSPVQTKPRRRRHGKRVRMVRSDPTVSAEEVRAALRGIIASDDFPATARNRKFLSYVTEKALAGKAADLSGYKVATEVFGRPTDFNPTTDPIVRIEAGKLRRDLEVYYLKSGAGEEIVISLPRGGYAPSFQRRAAAPAKSSFASLDPQGITVHALHGKDCALAQAEPSFRARLADRLAREPEVAVFAGPAFFQDGGLLDSDTVREVAQRNGTRFVLSGDAVGVGGAVVFTARLHDGATGRLMWSEDMPGTPPMLGETVVTRVLEARRRLADNLDGGRRSPGFP